LVEKVGGKSGQCGASGSGIAGAFVAGSARTAALRRRAGRARRIAEIIGTAGLDREV
jgi:hypothetical protein